MTLYEGSVATPTLTLTSYGGDTAATLVVHAPDGTTNPATTTASGGGATHTSDEQITLDQAGEWLYVWTVTGTGAKVEVTTVQVTPVPGTPDGARVYATTDDYAQFLQAEVPTGARRSLWVASRDVEDMLITAFYETDDDDMPTDADVIEAMKWATCAQAAYLRAIGDPYGVGAAGVYSSVSIGSVSLGRGAQPGGGTIPRRFSEDAMGFLRRAGLTGHGPITGW